MFKTITMETPFTFGKLAIGDDFTNRKKEIGRLTMNFASGINTVLISPRRWGKSSLVEKVSEEIKISHQECRIVMIDLFNVRSEEDFYKKLAEGVLHHTIGKIDEIISTVKKFFSRLIPSISFSPDQVHKFSLNLNWQEIKKDPEEILNLPQKIAENNKWNIIVCIDEFQNIGFFSDSLAFQKLLRSYWQRHDKVAYCLYGSKRHMMMEVFSSASMPFYKFGDLIFLDKISENDWGKFIITRFNETGKEISREQATRIAKYVDCHPYYVQQLSQICWFRCTGKMTDEIIDQSMDSLVLQLSLLFQNLTDNLSTGQLNFLKALVAGETKLGTQENILTYNLNSSANVVKLRKALIQKEIIDFINGKPEILDPVFKRWLKDWYFNN